MRRMWRREDRCFMGCALYPSANRLADPLTRPLLAGREQSCPALAEATRDVVFRKFVARVGEDVVRVTDLYELAEVKVGGAL